MPTSQDKIRRGLLFLAVLLAACTDEERPDEDGGSESCSAHADCDDQNPCTSDSCSAGSCVYANNTASCDDGIACTQGDVCNAGACAGAPNTTLCNDGDACTTDMCVPFDGCVHASSCNP